MVMPSPFNLVVPAHFRNSGAFHDGVQNRPDTEGDLLVVDQGHGERCRKVEDVPDACLFQAVPRFVEHAGEQLVDVPDVHGRDRATRSSSAPRPAPLPAALFRARSIPDIRGCGRFQRSVFNRERAKPPMTMSGFRMEWAMLEVICPTNAIFSILTISSCCSRASALAAVQLVDLLLEPLIQ